MAEELTNTRGSFGFQILPSGDLQNSATNVALLSRLWLDRKLIRGDDLGPGDPGDFDNGAWHSSCHLLGAGGAQRAVDGRIVWLEVSHNAARDEYFASATVREPTGVRTWALDSAEGRKLVAGSTNLGFVEGNSTGRISARNMVDGPDRFNLWRRQDFDQPVTNPLEGGKVWEHWCTLRDLRASNRVGLSALTAYISLVSALGDRFAATVARGRRDYGHPQQLCAMIHAGLVAKGSSTWETTPAAIPPAVEPLFLEADPGSALAGAEKLDWSNPSKYFMYARKLKSWSAAKDVRADLKKFVAPAK